MKLLQNVPRQRRPGNDGRSPACRILKKTTHKLDSKENLMNNEIQRFDFKGAALRTLSDEAGEPWFVAKDACDILGIDTNHLREALDDDEITNLRNSEVWNQPGRAPLIISEPGLYKLIMRSRKPEAKEFQRWAARSLSIVAKFVMQTATSFSIRALAIQAAR